MKKIFDKSMLTYRYLSKNAEFWVGSNISRNPALYLFGTLSISSNKITGFNVLASIRALVIKLIS